MRTVGSRKGDTFRVIREAAIDLIYEHGYESMNVRQLAEMVGMKAGSLYYHFASKEELLYQLVTDIFNEITEDLERRLAGQENGLERLDTFVSCLVEWHVLRNKETFIALMELKSLSDEKHREMIALRDQFDRTLDEILVQCVNEGVMVGEDMRLKRISIMTMVTGITRWYHPGGAATFEQFREFYVRAVRRLADVEPVF